MRLVESVGSLPNSSPFKKRLLHREQGVPLKGPFLGHFSQGNFAKVNENAHFSVFCIFGYFDPASLGHLSLLCLAVRAYFVWQFQPTSFGNSLGPYFVWTPKEWKPACWEGCYKKTSLPASWMFADISANILL